MIRKGTAKMSEDDDGNEVVYFRIRKVGAKESHGVMHQSSRGKAIAVDSHLAMKKLVVEYGWSVKVKQDALAAPCWINDNINHAKCKQLC